MLSDYESPLHQKFPKICTQRIAERLVGFDWVEYPLGYSVQKFDKSYDYTRFPQINITAIHLYILALGGHLMSQFYSVYTLWTSNALERQLQRVNIIEIVA